MAGYSNGLKNGNGKRERVDHEDDQEFMPLSKRINNIHLSPERLVNGGGASAYAHANGIAIPLVHPSLSTHNGFHENGISQRQPVNGYNAHHHQTNHFQPATSSEGMVNYNDTGGPGTSSDALVHNMNFHHAVSTLKVPEMSIQSPDVDSRGNCQNFEYRPSLNESANPHYYEANRTLFELYIQRQLRTQQVPHPNVYGNSTVNGVD